MGRTDANHTHGLEEAIYRGKRYQEIGADIIFIEAPKTIEEMKAICNEVPGCHMANIVEGGLTPNLAMAQIREVGFQFAAYPLTLLAASMQAMKHTLELMRDDLPRSDQLMDFEELRDRIGFNDYYEASQVYESSRRS